MPLECSVCRVRAWRPPNASSVSSMFLRIWASSGGRFSSIRKVSICPSAVCRIPSTSTRDDMAWVTRNPVPNRPVVSPPSNSLLEPPDNSALSSGMLNILPLWETTRCALCWQNSISTRSSPSRAPKSWAFWRSSKGQRTPDDSWLSKARTTRCRMRRASFR